MKTLPLLFLILLITMSAHAQQTQKQPCSDPEYRQFDFWVGEWDVDQGGKSAGTNNIQLILDNCVVFENWTSARGRYAGKSFNTYNAGLKKWQQFWVANDGSVLLLTGTYNNREMRFEGETSNPDGSKTLERLIFYHLSPDNVRQHWEQSSDSGKTWKTVFDGNYVRRK